MEPNIFSPKLQPVNKDNLSASLRSLAQWILIVVFGFLPIFFIPDVYTPLGFTKVYFIVLGLFGVLLFLSLSILRSGSLRVVVPPALVFFWLFVVVAVASSLLSGDQLDSLFGNVLEINTAGFLTLLALVMTLGLVFSGSKSAVSRLFMSLGISALVLQLFHLLRLFVGPEFLSFGIFSNSALSLIGSFNDLAIFSGLVIFITLIVLQQLSAHLIGRITSLFLVLSSLILLSVINFYIVWLTIGFFSLLMLLYLVSKDTWLKANAEDSIPVSRFTLGIVGVVCLVSAAFIISGDFLGGAINKLTNINYIEVRPSISATLDITRSVLAKDALLGVGPNRFEDAWRQYKDPVINQTIFWNTNFSAGSGYVPTLFITTGLAGGGLFIIFLGFFLYLGYQTFFVCKIKDYGWYLVGSVSFLSALYLWLMTLVYVPGVTILLLAALMTGVSFAVYITITPNTGVMLDVTARKQYGLLLIAGVLVIIISSTLSVILISKQFIANKVYADTVREFHLGTELVTVDEGLKRSQELVAQDIFVAERASLRLTELANMRAAEASAFDEQRYASVLAEGISLAEQAIALDTTNPDNYIILSNFYSLLDPTQFEGVRERNESLFNRARELDPTNPIYLVLMAQYMARVGDLTAARNYLQESIKQKNNYTDALLFLSQLDIQEGNTESAIAVTRSIISIEPTNPTRYFQLGVLLATTKNIIPAVEAFEKAIYLDNNYANARYFLALTYLDLNRNDEALTQLKIVQQSNQDSELVSKLIEQVESGQYVKPQSDFGVPVQNNQVISQEEGVTTATELPDTDLVTPVNRLPANPPAQDIVTEKPVEETNQEESNPIQ